MKILLQLMLSVLLIFAAGSAFAVKVDLLYQGQVSVTSQSPVEQSRAVQVALLQVLTKVSGNNPLLKNPDIQSHLTGAEKLVQQVGYAKPYLLNVDFDPSGVNELLRSLNIPLWGQNRPLILAWIEVETPGHPAEIVGNDSTSEVISLLKTNAEQRGLPILFPLMDITDINLISTKDIATMSIPTLMNATKRYAGEILLIGRVIQGPTGFVTQWKLVLNDNQWNWNFTGKTLKDMITPLMENVTTTLASRFAVVTSNAVQTELTLKVTGVTLQTDFGDLVHYLEHLTPVANVNVQRIAGSEVILNISLRGTEQSFTQLLSLGKKLTPINAAEWTYQWNH